MISLESPTEAIVKYPDTWALPGEHANSIPISEGLVYASGVAAALNWGTNSARLTRHITAANR